MSQKYADHLIYQSNCSLGVLNTKSIKISQNNVIAIVSSNGVSLMRNDSDQDESIQRRHYSKFSIANQPETFSTELHNIVKENLEKFNCEETQKVYLDHTIYPSNNTSQYRGYRSVEWAYGENRDNDLLTLLSIEHELLIYRSNGNIFEPVVNVSRILLDKFKKTIEKESNLNYETLRDLIYSTALMKVCWSEFVRDCFDESMSIKEAKKMTKRNRQSLIDSDDSHDHHKSSDQLINQPSTNISCLLITLSRNGKIYFFRINQTNEKVTCSYLNDWLPENLLINDIYQFKNYLILIYTNGKVELIQFEIDFNSIQENEFDFEKAIKKRFILWDEEDEIEVNDLLIYEHNSLIYIIFTKLTYIILRVLELNSKQQTQATEKRKRINPKDKSSSKSIHSVVEQDELRIKHSSTTEALFQMPSTGLCRLYNGDLLISSLDGLFTRIQFENDFKLKQENYHFEGLTNENYCPRSLCSTEDGYLCCTISHICVYFDHLEMRDSTSLTLFTPLTREETFNKIITLLESKSSIEFRTLYNLLEIFKIYMLTSEQLNFDFKNHFLKQNLQELSDLNLKTLRFVLTLCKQKSIDDQNRLNVHKSTADQEIRDEQTDQTDRDLSICREAENSKDENSEDQEEDEEIVNRENANQNFYLQSIESIEKVLNEHHFKKLCAFQSANKQISTLSAIQQKSLSLINSYLNEKENTDEKCPICDETILLTDYRQAACSNGHHFVRCTYSLLTCDLSEFDYRICTLCKRFSFIHPFIWPSLSSNSGFHCLYCS